MQKLVMLFAVFLCVVTATLASNSFAAAETEQPSVAENEAQAEEAVETQAEEAAEDKHDADSKPGFLYFAAKVGLSTSSFFSPSLSSANDSLLHYNYGLALGHNFFPATAIPLRLELDFTVRGGGLTQRLNGIFNETIRIKSLSTGMAQAWLDWPISGVIKPYAGGGAGAAFLKYRKVKSDGSTVYKNVDFAWAWMLGGGVTVRFSNGVNVDFGYRYVETTDLAIDFKHDHYDFKAHAHDLHIGLRSSF